MARTEQSMNSREDPFRLTVDQYGRLWLHIKQDGISVVIDLAEKDLAFQIMAAAMSESGYDPDTAIEHDGSADNDDQADE